MTTRMTSKTTESGRMVASLRVAFEPDRQELEDIIAAALARNVAERCDTGDPEWRVLPNWSVADTQARVVLGLRGNGLHYVEVARHDLAAIVAARSDEPWWNGFAAMAHRHAARLVDAACRWPADAVEPDGSRDLLLATVQARVNHLLDSGAVLPGAGRFDEDLFQIPACRVCGCTDEEACPGGCVWVPDPWRNADLCSACLPPDPGGAEEGA